MVGMKKIKICGITQERELDKLIELNVDYAGFVVFFPKSRRNNEIMEAEKLVNYIKTKNLSATDKQPVRTVAVMVSPDLPKLKAVEKAGFDILQVHGELSSDVKEQCKLPIWRAFNLSSYEDSGSIINSLKKLMSDDKISGIVFDGAAYGSGETFKWDSLKYINESINVKDKLFIMAGGLTPENVAEAVKTLNPDVTDVSSGVEYDDKTVRGKDLEKIELFVNAVRSCNDRE